MPTTSLINRYFLGCMYSVPIIAWTLVKLSPDYLHVTTPIRGPGQHYRNSFPSERVCADALNTYAKEKALA